MDEFKKYAEEKLGNQLDDIITGNEKVKSKRMFCSKKQEYGEEYIEMLKEDGYIPGHGNEKFCKKCKKFHSRAVDYLGNFYYQPKCDK